MITKRYRVWCVSWGDEEENGSDVLGYDTFSHEYKDRVRGIVYVPNTLLYDASDAVEAYADYVHSNRDGYECSWPLVFRVRNFDDVEVTQDFEVQRDFVPEFSAYALTTPEKKGRGA